ncbi:hypothetical protein DVJ83_17860 (plasmid) [Deinococcus wulumuqiensis]|uniref:Uncharacterized protein n=1 Tax=Deinococcus wulumuqiensis TaxID=980427 RepID=A0A345IMP2_9DEIO|nr:hypothetical protein [Deinococcus wulumuqiensis]AXH00965.1 hypothetical protein DVJ83_17860 [Deinococcus wulumuqiensis]
MLQLLSWQFLPAFPSLIGEQTLVRTGSGAVAVATFVMMPGSTNPVDHAPHWLLATGERVRDVVAWTPLTPPADSHAAHLVTISTGGTQQTLGLALSFHGAVQLALNHSDRVNAERADPLPFLPGERDQWHATRAGQDFTITRLALTP